MLQLASGVIPAILLVCSFAMLFYKGDLFSEFLNGAAEGLRSTFGLIPVFAALCVGTELLKASGAADIFAEIFGGVLGVAGIPKELASFLFVRPVSGSAAITMMRNVFENCGPDSYEGFLASVIMGSGDTLIYIIGVYYSSVGIKKTGYSLFAAVLASVFSVLFCSAICKIMFFS